MNVLHKFCEALGQQVSIEKSNIMFSKNTPHHLRREIVQASGLKEVKELGMYLGVALTGQSPKVKNYLYLIEKVRSILAN